MFFYKLFLYVWVFACEHGNSLSFKYVLELADASKQVDYFKHVCPEGHSDSQGSMKGIAFLPSRSTDVIEI